MSDEAAQPEPTEDSDGGHNATDEVLAWVEGDGEALVGDFIADCCDVDKIGDDEVVETATWSKFVAYAVGKGVSEGSIPYGRWMFWNSLDVELIDDYLADSAWVLRSVD